MRLIVGTYRKKDYISRALASVDKHLAGVSDIVFVDDSGDSEHSAWLRQYGHVVEVGGQGYGKAMTAVCEAAQGQECMFLEEDFTFITDVRLSLMSEVLYNRPYLAQIALLRGPHFPIEHEHGGLIEALQHKGHKFVNYNGVIEHEATFTCNPSVWRGSVFASGWPTCKWSEDRKRDELLRQGYRFGYLPGIKVEHDGVRTGHGY
ncbi:galactosyl transferase [Gordonia phage Neville]|uniref:Glycosyltransferase n=2 Tax=Nevillevirus TaxID=3044773 RepID=A0A515MH55_9CAUD|nr:galactosyl transferase [Gordonia phage Neville]YP_010246099.1 galactosyl transferase [Gordonia phage Trax]AXQ64476.1 glycosyltransferase [Gordonia phage Neville]QDM56001.1 glycosyltransferase [Gordonia phage Trax]